MQEPINYKISIIVPVYNVEDYLSYCVGSLISQTYHNIEIILVDDGSTDNSGSICDTFSQQDGRIKVVHKQNEGVGKARNEGIKNANGDYVVFVDADDWLESNMCQDCLTELNREAVDIIQFGYYKVNKDGERFNQILPPSLTINNLQKDRTLIAPVFDSGIGLAVWDKMIKREILTENDLWFDNKKRGEDFTFVVNLLQHVTSIISRSIAHYNYRIIYKSNEKFDINIIKNHVENYHNILTFFGQSRFENKSTQIYLQKLAIMWFILVIPLNIANTSRLKVSEKVLWIKGLLLSEVIQGWLCGNGSKPDRLKWKALLSIYKVNSPHILFISAKALSFLRRFFHLSNF